MLMRLLRQVLRDNPARNGAPLPEPRKIALQPRYERGGSILVITSGSEGDAVKEISTELLRPFEGQATGVHVIDVKREHWLDQLADALQEPVWFVISYFGVAQHLSLDGDATSENLWEAARIPFVRIYGDTPAYYPAAHRIASRNSVNAYTFKEHGEFFLRWNQPTGITLVTPPVLIDPLPERDIDFSAKLSGKIIFPKNGNDPDALIAYWRNSLPPTVAHVLEAAAEAITAKGIIDQPIKIENYIMDRYRALGVDISSHRQLCFFLVAQLDDYLRRVKSTMIVRSLLDLPIEVRGNRWQHIDFSGKAAQYVSDSNYSQTRELLRTCLAVVDMSPNTHYEPHDRPLRAAGRHTAFLTNSQAYLGQHFPNHRDFTFDFSPDSIRATVAGALENPDRTVELGRTQAATMRNLTSDESFARTIIAGVDTCALVMGGRPPGTQNFVSFQPD